MSEDADALALCSLVDEQQNTLYLNMQVNQFSLDVGPEVTKLVERLLEQVKETQMGSSRASCWTSVHAFGSSGLHASIEANLTSDLTVVRTARVPIIKFVYRGIPVDLIYALTDLASAPSLADIEKDEFLLHVARENRLNVNGVRTVLQIEKLVGVPLEHYRCVLRAVKRWAVRRRVYHNKFGYPNGVVVAILVARICQMGSGLQPSQLLKLVFLHVAQMTSLGVGVMEPIFITPSLSAEGRPLIGGLPRPYTPKSASSQDELFPVINPAYPYVNSGHGIGRSGFLHFAEEARRAACLLQSSLPFSEALSQTWQPYALVSDYVLFAELSVLTCATDAASCHRDFDAWHGYLESRIRMLLYALESFVDIRPYPAMLSIAESRDPATSKHEKSGCYYIGLRPRGCCLAPETIFEEANKAQLTLMFQQVHICMRAFISDVTDPAHMQGFERNMETMRYPEWKLLRWPQDTFPRELMEA